MGQSGALANQRTAGARPGNLPQKVYLQNMEAKIKDDEFIGDKAALKRPTENYDQTTAFELVWTGCWRK
jgi:hypothetical protein